jgi:hypothetical protein
LDFSVSGIFEVCSILSLMPPVKPFTASGRDFATANTNWIVAAHRRWSAWGVAECAVAEQASWGYASFCSMVSSMASVKCSE